MQDMNGFTLQTDKFLRGLYKEDTQVLVSLFEKKKYFVQEFEIFYLNHIQFVSVNMTLLLNKPYVNGVTLREEILF